MGSPSIPASPPLPPPPPSMVDEGVLDARRKLKRKGTDKVSTLLTSPQGDPFTPTLGVPSLLGTPQKPGGAA